MKFKGSGEDSALKLTARYKMGGAGFMQLPNISTSSQEIPAHSLKLLLTAAFGKEK